MLSSYFKKNIAVLGLGVSGRALCHFFLAKGAQVIAFDSNEKLVKENSEIIELQKKGLICSLEPDSFKDFDLIAKSPGILNDHPWIKKARKQGCKNIYGEIDIACYEMRNSPHHFLAITGSNGKTTTTSLATHVLKEAGFSAKSCGNIGYPLICELLVDHVQPQVYVVELSSYQLETLNTPLFKAGVILNITPNHLDSYQSFDDYAKTKIALEDCIKQDGKLFVYDHTFCEFRHFFKKLIPQTYGYKLGSDYFCNRYETYYGGMPEFALPDNFKGKISHDIENLMAAYLLCKEMGVSSTTFLKALETFKKPPHRIEFVKNICGITFIDDSKATSVDAVLKAIQSIQERVVLIAGGIDKGGSYAPWLESFKEKVKKVYAIGKAAEKIKNELTGHVEVDILSNLEEATKAAYTLAEKGETVLLSPGCSSFDMFKDYAHRGEEFKRIVNTLGEKE